MKLRLERFCYINRISENIITFDDIGLSDRINNQKFIHNLRYMLLLTLSGDKSQYPEWTISPKPGFYLLSQ